MSTGPGTHEIIQEKKKKTPQIGKANAETPEKRKNKKKKKKKQVFKQQNKKKKKKKKILPKQKSP